MRKRCITGILLAALLVSLCGCTSVFDKEYLSVRPYEEPSNLLTDADTTQIRNYAGLMRALNAMAAQYERSFVLAFGDYDGIIADDLAAACEELRTGTAIGAYCIDSVTYETEQVVAYCEASITIAYNRPENEVRSIYSAQTQKSILDCVVDALDRQKTQFAIQHARNGRRRGACALGVPESAAARGGSPGHRRHGLQRRQQPEDLRRHAALRHRRIRGQRPPHTA